MQVKLTPPDQFGQCHPIESEALIKAKLQELETEVDTYVATTKKKNKKGTELALEKAQTQCPDQLTDAFKLIFLRCEVFNVKKAAKRYVKYWDKRLELFGPDLAFLKPTLNGMFQDLNLEAFRLGLLMILPGVHDPDGRGMLTFDTSKQDRSVYTRLDIVRLMWYMIHFLLDESEATQQKGIIALANPRHAHMSQFDPGLDKVLMESIRGALPVRIACVAVSHPPSFVRLIWPVLKLVVDARLLQRVKMCSGSDESVLQQLQDAVGITLDDIPAEMGGNLQLDYMEWLETQRKAGK